ncbi:hypothetical protein NDU88_001626 [Pleurodeles waltl]|uniref:Uncharacterized protein n=1 Tax=Pleurodeles waltl TaxID=8319 RepID=A0AAV7W011_PLEWA|nr:hypothetical protein NDU88_001626 [Pleurodeles waltl]
MPRGSGRFFDLLSGPQFAGRYAAGLPALVAPPPPHLNLRHSLGSTWPTPGGKQSASGGSRLPDRQARPAGPGVFRARPRSPGERQVAALTSNRTGSVRSLHPTAPAVSARLCRDTQAGGQHRNARARCSQPRLPCKPRVSLDLRRCTDSQLIEGSSSWGTLEDPLNMGTGPGKVVGSGR